jgi:cobalt/nickel transport system permease protein
VIGVGVTVVAGSAVFWAVRRRRTNEAGSTELTRNNVQVQVEEKV